MSKQTVLVTGGSSGIGLATTALMLEHDLRVILVDRDKESLRGAKESFLAGGATEHDIEICCMDLAIVSEIKKSVPKLKLIQEGLFGLVSNAAIEVLKPVKDFTLEELELTWKVNMLAPILLIQACYPYLVKGSGSIVHVGSTADERRDANYSVYGGSKAFMKSLIGHAAQETGFDGVRINLVTPGATDTPLLQHLLEKGQWSSEHIGRFKKSIPIEQRFASSTEIAQAVWFALSGPRYFHGEDIRIYGGQV